MRVRCPDCAGKTRAVTSRALSPTVRVGYVACCDSACGWTGLVTVAVERTHHAGRRRGLHLDADLIVAAFSAVALATHAPEARP